MADYYLLRGFGYQGAGEIWQWHRPDTRPVTNTVEQRSRDIWDRQVASHQLAWTDELSGDRYFVSKAVKVYRLALVGHGSSIAYYLSAMPEEFKHANTALCGVVDAWDRTVRGDGFINHESQQIAHWGSNTPPFSTDYMDRAAFVRMNQEAFTRAKQAGASVVKREVTAVRKRGEIFELETKGGLPILAVKVILGTGAGPHFDFGSERGPVISKAVTPLEVAKQQAAIRGKVLHLDDFMVLYPRNAAMHQSVEHQEPARDQVVVVHGPNAGIDAVQRAWQYGFQVIWLTGTEPPVWLEGNRLPIHRVWNQHKDDPAGPLWYVKIGRTRPEVQSDGEFVTVTFTPTPKQGEQAVPVTVRASAYVIALGQNAMAPGAIGDVLKQGGITVQELEPIYDVNQIFGLPYQTALGLQTKGTRYNRGLQIIGAAASSLAATYKGLKTPIEHNYLEQFQPADNASIAEAKNMLSALRYLKKKKKETDTEVDVVDLLEHQVNPDKVPEAMKSPKSGGAPAPNPFRKVQGLATPQRPATTAVMSVLVSTQLGGVRAAIAAMRGLMPGYIYRGQVNLSSDDRTMVAVYLAREYPHLTGDDLEEIIQFVMKLRRSKASDNHHGSVLGFDEEVHEEIKSYLAKLNEKRFFQA
ncbi:hypothetical protein [Stigmatella erecta]|uniref:Uncharacterized protein n=1 Tax=Stigmatella erecta TaxID=83460 RepID=A0A1I0HN12_9BACT|nr:hypothetical protein [Stigmatella erecta]SET85358.1 hypothetical protein SAMN05443639_10515 [Stigmatella erecta]